MGVGSAPIYPCIIHSTPESFGRENSQAIIGVQMASAYIGSTFMPPVFGLIAQYGSIGAYPVYLMGLCAVDDRGVWSIYEEGKARLRVCTGKVPSASAGAYPLHWYADSPKGCRGERREDARRVALGQPGLPLAD